MSIALLIVAALVILAGFVAVVKGRFNYRVKEFSGHVVDKTANARPWGFGILAAGLLLLALDSVTIVSAKSVGVPVAFGRAGANLENGFHVVAPWSSVEEFDATRQSLKLSGGEGDSGDPIVVRLANSTTATVEISLEWQIDDKGDVTQLYLDYRNFNNIQSNVVHRRLSAVLNKVFEKYDPLASIKGDGSAIPLAKLEDQARTALQAEMPSGILIQSLYVPKIVFADSVQGQINAYINAVNETKIAEQQKLTATARQQANDLLAKGGKLTPEILFQNCLDMVERMTKDGKALPPAFTCGTGAATAVIPVK